MNTISNTIANAKRLLAEAERMLMGLQEGKDVPAGQTLAEAVIVAKQKITLYENLLKQHEWWTKG